MSMRSDKETGGGSYIVVVCNNCNETGFVPALLFEDRRQSQIACQRCGDGRMLPPTIISIAQGLEGLSAASLK